MPPGRAPGQLVLGAHERYVHDVDPWQIRWSSLRPGVWHGYENCQRFEVYNCCFSSELLRRELAWTREDPLLGFLLWAGPYSSPGRGVLTISLDPPALGECLVHLDALASLRHRPPALHRPDIVGRLALLFGQLFRRARCVIAAGPSAEAAVSGPERAGADGSLGD